MCYLALGKDAVKKKREEAMEETRKRARLEKKLFFFFEYPFMVKFFQLTTLN